MSPPVKQVSSGPVSPGDLLDTVTAASETAIADSLTEARIAASTEQARNGREDSLFEHYAWLYIFFRERIFRNDTGRIIRNLWPDGKPAPGTRLIELGCGPGFYSLQLARCFPQISLLGVDQSPKQLQRAREKARRQGLTNCEFASYDVLALPQPDASYDVVIASRLFTVLPEPTRAVSEIFRVLAPGGRSFIAEPKFAFWASIPLFLMRVLARLTGFKHDSHPDNVRVLSEKGFEDLFATQPWNCIKTWTRGRYQYALCQKH